jgi:hypothetical protein
MEAGDVEGVMSNFAEDFTMRSPVTRVPFHGAAAHRLLRSVLEGYEHWECVAEFHSGSDHVLITRARIGGRDVEVADLLRTGPDGRVVDFTAYARPLDGTASFARVIAPVIARRQRRSRALLVAAVTRPLPGILRFGDRLISAIAAMHTNR